MAKSTLMKDEQNALSTMFAGAAPVIDVGEQLDKSSPYIVFASTRSESYGELAAKLPGLQDSDPVLVRPAPLMPLKLQPYRFYLMNARSYFVIFDNAGLPVRSTRDKSKTTGDSAWKDVIETVVLAVTPEGISPARCTFKTTKVKPARIAVDTLKLAQSEAWGKMTAAHQATLAVPHAQLRFTVTVSLKPGTSRTTGNRYVAANGVAQPTGIGDWKQVSEWWNDAANQAQLAECVKGWERRCQELKDRKSVV